MSEDTQASEAEAAEPAEAAPAEAEAQPAPAQPEGPPERVVVFEKNHGIQAHVKVTVFADKAERAVAVARAALHQLADDAEAFIK